MPLGNRLKLFAHKTSMHSSRVRTARLLPISPSMHCTGGSQVVPLVPGGACLWSGGGLCIPACNGADTPCEQNHRHM